MFVPCLYYRRSFSVHAAEDRVHQVVTLSDSCKRFDCETVTCFPLHFPPHQTMIPIFVFQVPAELPACRDEGVGHGHAASGRDAHKSGRHDEGSDVNDEQRQAKAYARDDAQVAGACERTRKNADSDANLVHGGGRR